ncbi:MAG: hypothetical protein Rhob2KO_03180 [Rhodopirellula baltica]
MWEQARCDGDADHAQDDCKTLQVVIWIHRNTQSGKSKVRKWGGQQAEQRHVTRLYELAWLGTVWIDGA